MTAALVALMLAAAVPAAGDSPSGRAEAAIRLALASDAEWTMERRLPGSERVLRSSGSVSCRPGTGIVWRTSSPFESSVTMTAGSMVFADEEGVRTKELGELPHYAEIRRMTDAFVAGDPKAFDGVLSFSADEGPGDGWRAVLRPEDGAMGRLFTEVEFSGSRLPTNLVMRTGDGGESRIRFRESTRDR